MANWISLGGCFNATRWANDGAGAGLRDWAAEPDVSLVEHPLDTELILATAWDSDDMDSISGDFEVQFRNLTDAGAWIVMGAATEIREGTATDLVNNNAIIAAEELGRRDCSGKSPTRLDGIEREGANAVTMASVASKKNFDLHWAIDFSGGTVLKEYEFRIVETSTSNVYATLAATVTIIGVGVISGVTKDNAGANLGSCFVTAHEKIEGSGPPHDHVQRGKTTSDGSGNYTVSGLKLGKEHFIRSSKEGATNVADTTDDVVQPV